MKKLIWALKNRRCRSKSYGKSSSLVFKVFRPPSKFGSEATTVETVSCHYIKLTKVLVLDQVHFSFLVKIN